MSDQPQAIEAEDPMIDLAGDIADALCQLAILVRTQPVLARKLIWDLGRLTGGVLDIRDRAAVLTAARDLGVRATQTRRSTSGIEGWALQFGQRGDVRVNLATEEPISEPSPTRRPARFVPDMDTSR